jgi:hypothetical protein
MTFWLEGLAVWLLAGFVVALLLGSGGMEANAPLDD